jgi:hypothetical protein
MASLERTLGSVSGCAGVIQERGQMGNEGEGTRQGGAMGFVLWRC